MIFCNPFLKQRLLKYKNIKQQCFLFIKKNISHLAICILKIWFRFFIGKHVCDLLENQIL